MNFQKRVLIVLTVGVLGIGCNSSSSSEPLEAAPIPRLPADALAVPIVRQATDYSCGAAITSSILHYWNVEDTYEQSFYKGLGTTKKNGTDARKMRDFIKGYGLKVELKEKLTIADLRTSLSKGETVIVDYQAWADEDDELDWEERWEDGHYSVVVGLDENFIYLMDSSVLNSYTYIPISEFITRWHDYESTGGKIWRNYQLGIIISGKNPLANFPSTLQKTN